MHIPQKLSKKEWEEIMMLDEVRDEWLLDADKTVETFSLEMYAVKFSYYRNSSRGLGDFYILSGGEKSGATLTIRRFGKFLSVDN